MRRSFAILPICAVLAAVAWSQEADRPKAPSWERAADSVLAAIEAGDDEALAGLAGAASPDPWLVADVLIARGRLEAASAFASGTPSPAYDGLRTWVASMQGKEPETTLRSRHLTATRHFQLREYQQALAEELRPDGPLDTVPGIRLMHLRAEAHTACRAWDESFASFVAAAEAARRLGWWNRAFWLYFKASAVARRVRDWKRAAETAERILSLAESLGDKNKMAGAHNAHAMAREGAGDPAGALEHYGRALELYEQCGHEAGAATVLCNAGVSLSNAGRLEEAVSNFRKAYAIRKRLKDERGMAGALVNLAIGLRMLDRDAKALEAFGRALEIGENRGDRGLIAMVCLNLGEVHRRLGYDDRALAQFERARDLFVELGEPADTARAIHNAGIIYGHREEHSRAVECYSEALAAFTRARDARGVARASLSLGSALQKQGAFPEARRHLERGLRIWRARKDPSGVAQALAAFASLDASEGLREEAIEKYRDAITRYESIGRRSRAAFVRAQMAACLARLGRYAEAFEHYAVSRRELQEAGHPTELARVVRDLSLLYDWLGDTETALAHLDKAIEIEGAGGRGTVRRGLRLARASYESDLGRLDQARAEYLALRAELDPVADQRLFVILEANLATVEMRLGHMEEALVRVNRTLDLVGNSGSKTWSQPLLLSRATIQKRLGRLDAALETLDLLDADLAAHPTPRLQAASLMLRADILRRNGDPRAAVAAARKAVLAVELILTGLAEGEGAQGRDEFRQAFREGALAAYRSGDPDALSWFLERGRSWSFREALAARETLQDEVLGDELRSRLREARSAERRELDRVRIAVGDGELAEARAARKAHEKARLATLAAEAVVQRKAKASASLVLPPTDDLGQIRARLRVGDAFVSYGYTPTHAVALIVEPKGARMAALASRREIGAAIGAAFVSEAPYVVTEHLPALRKLLVDPLALGPGVRRLLVSPTGRIGYVPFALLAPGREVAYLPSGNVHGLLLEDQEKRGTGVLALGAPDYGTRGEEVTAKRDRGGPFHRLAPLPATRAEAEAVGDVKLVGKDATESGFLNAVGKRGRWRAIHLACHGLLDPDHPLFSSLAVTADESDDGFLTCLEIFRQRIPADLVALSACETGKGRAFEVEGIVGLTRAFMFAGSPRVLCSLWKVDDAATKALMVKFYALWNPADGLGSGAAEALRGAQEHVRSHEEWAHPRYWAAWVLWGLPD